MQVTQRIVLILALFNSILGALCAVTQTQMVDNLDWFISEQITPKLCSQIKGMFLTLKKRENGHLDLRSKCKKKVCTRLARLRGHFEHNSIDYKATVAAWHLVNHYSMIPPKVSVAIETGGPGLDNKEEDQCLICFEELKTPINTLCKHIFCAKCLLEWFAQKPMGKSGVHELCPFCRTDFGINIKLFLHYHPLYESLAQENLRCAQEVDYRELASAQSAFDEEYIAELFDENELAQLIQLQRELEAQKSQSEGCVVDSDDGVSDRIDDDQSHENNSEEDDGNNSSSDYENGLDNN